MPSQAVAGKLSVGHRNWLSDRRWRRAHETALTSYTADRFDASDQHRLQEVVIRLARRRCHVVLSNSTAPEIAVLYDGNTDARRAGIRAYRVPARRAINSNAARRGPIEEYVITNVKPQPA